MTHLLGHKGTFFWGTKRWDVTRLALCWQADAVGVETVKAATLEALRARCEEA